MSRRVYAAFNKRLVLLLLLLGKRLLGKINYRIYIDNFFDIIIGKFGKKWNEALIFFVNDMSSINK